MNASYIGKDIWKIAEGALRTSGGPLGNREVILAMTFIRRLDAVLEATRQAVLDEHARLDGTSPAERDEVLRRTAGQAYYNTSPLTLSDLTTRVEAERLAADFGAWLDGFSPNVREVLGGFGFRERVEQLPGKGTLRKLIGRFTSPDLHLGPGPLRDADGTVVRPGLDERAMCAVFEELVWRCREENGGAAGEHRTPRDAVELMARLVVLPVAEDLQPGSYTLYDGACGTGTALTAANDTLRELAAGSNGKVSTHLHGQEIDPVACAIFKARILLAGQPMTASTIVGGAQHSTLSDDAFPARKFDFMLSNPPHGRRWKAELERMGGKKRMRDPRFVTGHADDPEFSLIPRASDSQMLFLVNAVSKMRRESRLGSRIVQIHNGASLFTGDAGQGESNIRRWIVENDWLEAIVGLPGNMFYNASVSTYVWVLSNRKARHRRGRVQLIDAAAWFRPLRGSLGKKNRELADVDIARICETFLAFEENEHSRILDNAALGYRKVEVERPLRIEDADPDRVHTDDEIAALKESGKRRESAPPVVRKIHPPGTAADPLRGLFAATIDGRSAVVEYEPDEDLHDTERIPLREKGGIEAFLEREILPYTPDAWYRPNRVKVGYRIDFRSYFLKPEPLRGLDEIRSGILALERETEGLLHSILEGVER